MNISRGSAAALPNVSFACYVLSTRTILPPRLSRLGLRAASTAVRRNEQKDSQKPFWHEVNHGRLGLEIEGWPCSRTTKRQSGYPKVRCYELQDVVSEICSKPRVDSKQSFKKDESAQLRGLMKAVLVRPDMMFADEVLGMIGRLIKRHGCGLSEDELFKFAELVLQQALRLACPSEEEMVQAMQANRRQSTMSESVSLSRLARELFPHWIEKAISEGVQTQRLWKVVECWERFGQMDDIEGIGLFTAICLHLQEAWRVRDAIENLLASGVDLRLCYQPLLLESLLEQQILWKEHVEAPSGTLPALVQQAAKLARRGESDGVSLRRHGALLITPTCREGQGHGYEVLAMGFNHAACPLGPRGFDTHNGLVRTFSSIEEAIAAGLPRKHCKMRLAQRHAEIHCLLQLERLQDAYGLEMLIVELADVGPGLKWAEPCSRGCRQFLTKQGVARILFTDGQGGLSQQVLEHKPELKVPELTFASTSRLKDDAISERACLDIEEKLRREAQGDPAWDLDDIVASGALAAAKVKEHEPLNLRGSVLPLPRRRGRIRTAMGKDLEPK